MHRSKIISVLLLAAGVSTTLPAIAEGETDWNCRNTSYEISCDETGCEASDAHTPMDIYLGDNTMEVCAYTGCWSGMPTYQQRGGRFEVWTGHNLPFSTRTDWTANISITVDTETAVATVLVGNLYATPATCETHQALVD
ncbi:MAG: hypothetical protein AAFZ91_12345 [Pseudomonadota bacterium]